MAETVAARQTAQRQRADPQRAAARPERQGAMPARAGIDRLQRALGNRGMYHLLRSGAIQAKLAVGPADDEYEREADRVADEVMRMPDPASGVTVQRATLRDQRLCPECEEELQRKLATRISRAPSQINRKCPACEEKLRRQAAEPEGLVQRARFGQNRDVSSLPHLPRTIANQAVGGLLEANSEDARGHDSSTTGIARFAHDFSRIPVHSKSAVNLQAKLKVNTPGDVYEQEADRVAEQVTSMPEPQLQRACACGGGCASCQTKQLGQGDDRVQAKSGASSSPIPTAAPPIVHEVLNSSGERLDSATRAFMEPRFGHDFSRVRVHRDAQAAEAAREVNALAFTAGSDIVFAPGRYAPGSNHGNWLLAHELTHVVQQEDGTTAGPSGLIQRLGDLTQVPSVIGCDVATSTSGRVVTNVLFGSGSAALSPTAVADINSFAAAWNGLGRSPLVRIDGFASTDGSDPDNWILSCARARAVETQLVTSSPGAPRIPSASISEVLAQGETDEFGPTLRPNRRATISADMTPAAASAVFSESPTQLFAGYDDSVTPNILVVPTAGTREAQVGTIPPGAVVNFASLDPTVATVSPIVDGIEVTGVADGNTAIEALSPAGAVLDTLVIEVKDRRDIAVDYHFMSDTVAAPGVAHTTTRSPADAPTLTGTLNRIWERQANVLFTTGTTDSPVVATDLGADVQGNVSTDPEWAAVIAFRTGAEYNVFLVWEFNLLGTAPGVDTAEAGTAGADTLLEDVACADAFTIAHEAGHFMGIGLPHPANTIMSGCGGADRQRVTHAQAAIVNS